MERSVQSAPYPPSGDVQAGCDWRKGRLVHDLRRTAARDFRRRGVSEGEIMKLCGWKTRATFDRYHIIDEADLTEPKTCRA